MASLWRLFGFLRPYRRAALGSLLFAWLAMGVTVLIPLLIGKAVDAIDEGSASTRPRSGRSRSRYSAPGSFAWG